MILDVPYFTQYSARDFSWQERSCGVACLKMVLDFYDVGAPTLDDLIEDGKEDGYIDGVGWKHDYLVKMGLRYGLVGSHRKEFKGSEDNLYESILEHIKYLKEEKPVIVSVVKNFEHKDKPHLVVLVGFREDDSGEITGFYYHEPDSLNPADDGNRQFVDMETFREYWRKMSVFLSR